MDGMVKTVKDDKRLLIYDLPKVNGKRRQKTVTFHGTLKDAKTELRRLIALAEGGNHVEASKMTVGELLDEYLKLEIQPPKRSPGTFAVYTSRVNTYLKPHIGAEPLQKLTGLHIERAYAVVLGEGKIKPQTLHIAHYVLSGALKAAMRWGLITKDPSAHIRLGSGEKREKRVLDAEDTVALLAGLVGTELYIPTLIAVSTGLRRGEVLGLRWSDLDLENGSLFVRQALSRIGGVTDFRPPKTKTGKRGLPLPRFVVDVLRQHRKTQKIRRIGLDLVCDDGDGNPIAPTTFSSNFVREMDKLGYHGVTPHSLRHGYASIVLDRGHSIEEARDLLGHAKISTTAIYLHKPKGSDSAVAQTMDDVLTGKAKRKKGTR